MEDFKIKVTLQAARPNYQTVQVHNILQSEYYKVEPYTQVNRFLIVLYRWTFRDFTLILKADFMCFRLRVILVYD